MTSDIDLLLVGKSGNGKSRTGNCILGSRIFKSSASMTSVTIEIQFAMCEIQGRIVKVVDGPGLCDTRMDTEQAVQIVNDKLEYAIATNPMGYQAMIVVLKYGCRLTGEEQDTISYLKSLFGESFLQDYGVIVMTCGDVFEKDLNKERSYFKIWCKGQTGEFANILKECRGRVVLFDNTTQDPEKQISQIRELMHWVDEIQTQRKPYTDENFELAREARARVVTYSKKPTVTEEMSKEASLIAQKLTAMQMNRFKENWLQELEELIERAEILHDRVVSQDQGTGELKTIIQHTEAVKKNISEEIKLCVEKETQLQILLKKSCLDEDLRKILEGIDWQDLVETYNLANQAHTNHYVRNVMRLVKFPFRRHTVK